MYNLLKGKRGIIFGALDPNSIAWKVAKRCHDEGALFTLTNAPVAMRMGEINHLAEKTNAQIKMIDKRSNAVSKPRLRRGFCVNVTVSLVVLLRVAISIWMARGTELPTNGRLPFALTLNATA